MILTTFWARCPTFLVNFASFFAIFFQNHPPDRVKNTSDRTNGTGRSSGVTLTKMKHEKITNRLEIKKNFFLVNFASFFAHFCQNHLSDLVGSTFK